MDKNKIKTIVKRIALGLILVILFAIILSVVSIYQKGIEITQLSAQGSRQMMGYLLKTKEDTLIVVDGGTEEDSENLKKYINQHDGIVNYWFITHAHDDHIGAMVNLLEKQEVKIEHVICSLNELAWYQENEGTRAQIVERLYQVLEQNEKTTIKEASMNEEMDIDNIKVKILGIKNPEIKQNPGNNQSMVFKVYVNNKSILFLGDTGIESGQKLLESNGDELQSYAVQMAHHGQNGATKEVYQKISPTICFWPTPEWLWNNDIGTGEDSGPWKTKEVREWMKELNAHKNYVEKDGDITIKIW